MACHGLATLGMDNCPGSLSRASQYLSTLVTSFFFVLMLCLAQISSIDVGWPMTRVRRHVSCTVCPSGSWSAPLYVDLAATSAVWSVLYAKISQHTNVTREIIDAASLIRQACSPVYLQAASLPPALSPPPPRPLIYTLLLNTGCSSFWIQAQMPRLWTQTC